MFTAIVARVKRIFLTLLSLFRRVICLRKRRPSQESILPITISHGKEIPVLPPVPDSSTLNHYYSSPNPPIATNFNSGYNQQIQQQQQLHHQQQISPSLSTSNSKQQFSQYSQSASWNSFGSNQLASLKEQQQQQQQMLAAQAQQQTDQVNDEQEEDFFRDMTPKVKQQRVYYLPSDQDNLQERSNKFNFDPAIASLPNSSRLGDLEDVDIDSPTTCDSASAWDEEVNSYEIENQIKKVREEERRKRQAEIAARKKEKEKRNPNRTLSATKIS